MSTDVEKLHEIRTVLWEIIMVISFPVAIGGVALQLYMRNHLLIKPRMPVFTAIGWIVIWISSISVGLTRILPRFPCSVILWNDLTFSVSCMIFYLFKTALYYYNFEWVHERLKFFKLEKKKKTYDFFHRNRHWVTPKGRLIVLGIVCLPILAVFVYFEAAYGDQWAGIDDVTACAGGSWEVFRLGLAFIIIIMYILIARKIRAAHDTYQMKVEFARCGYSALVYLFTYLIITFTNQLGIPYFTPSTLIVEVSVYAFSIISLWIPCIHAIRSDRTEAAIAMTNESQSRHPSHYSRRTSAGGETTSTGKTQELWTFIESPVGYAAFEKYLVRSFCVENLCFVQSVIEFHQSCREKLAHEGDKHGRAEILQKSVEIYHKYIEPNAVLWVNISHRTTVQLKNLFDGALKSQLVRTNTSGEAENIPDIEKIDVPTPDLPKVFDVAFQEIFALLDEPFRHFKLTEDYAQSRFQDLPVVTGM